MNSSPPIPHPNANAFSWYVNCMRAPREVQQHELSKQAGKVWKSMSDEEKKPFYLVCNGLQFCSFVNFLSVQFCSDRLTPSLLSHFDSPLFFVAIFGIVFLCAATGLSIPVDDDIQNALQPQYKLGW
uniref:HMG box domain-containing protein n=1 Tax=Psilocybe cubensis TaxID=181762 RepID=A0A8H7XT19_PSICU